jgi:RNA polymerase sigma-70 factor, ECF subfamily
MLEEDFQRVLDGVRQGDEAAFTRLYVDLHPPLLRYLTVLSPEAAEDVASECWLQVARGLDGFEGGERQFRAWVFTIARNKLTDLVRYEARRPTVTWEATDDLGPAVPDVADEIVEGEATRRALELVSRLPRDQAEAVLLRVVGGLDYDEIAHLMDRSTGAARVLVHRGLKSLGRDLEAEAAAVPGGAAPPSVDRPGEQV